MFWILLENKFSFIFQTFFSNLIKFKFYQNLIEIFTFNTDALWAAVCG